MDALQETYGDASQTVLDQQAAGRVLAVLRQRGWSDLRTMTAVVASAPGQSITLDPSALVGDWVLFREDTLGPSRFYAKPR